MIFVTVGTQLPFNRLMKTMDDWCATTGRGEEVFAQTCRLVPGSYVPKHFSHVEELNFEEISARLADASVIVSHAGMGTIISALMLGKRIVLMPRRAAFAEQRNDHQLATVERFAGRSGVFVSMTESELPSVLESAVNDRTIVGQVRPSAYADASLITEVRREILGVGSQFPAIRNALLPSEKLSSLK